MSIKQWVQYNVSIQYIFQYGTFLANGEEWYLQACGAYRLRYINKKTNLAYEIYYGNGGTSECERLQSFWARLIVNRTKGQLDVVFLRKAIKASQEMNKNSQYYTPKDNLFLFLNTVNGLKNTFLRENTNNSLDGCFIENVKKSLCKF